MTIEEINRLDREAFSAALGGIFDHSPWIAEAAFACRPFADREALHQAMLDVVEAADEATRIAFLRAHPDLAGKAMVAGTMTAHSTAEQAGAGLGRLSPADFARFTALNDAYRRKHDFPFIIAVKGLDAAAILDAFERRLQNDRAAEMRTALDQIARITGFRLAALIG